jgi:hypothetical protein
MPIDQFLDDVFVPDGSGDWYRKKVLIDETLY